MKVLPVLLSGYLKWFRRGTSSMWQTVMIHVFGAAAWHCLVPERENKKRSSTSPIVPKKRIVSCQSFCCTCKFSGGSILWSYPWEKFWRTRDQENWQWAPFCSDLLNGVKTRNLSFYCIYLLSFNYIYLFTEHGICRFSWNLVAVALFVSRENRKKLSQSTGFILKVLGENCRYSALFPESKLGNFLDSSPEMLHWAY